jgi:CheY-like chemotaxis protein
MRAALPQHTESRTMPPLDSPCILVVADGQESARTVVEHLSGDIAAGVHLCARPDHALAQAQAHAVDVIVLALPSLALVEHDAPALREVRGCFADPPFLIALCNATGVAAAARLCRQGVIDDYVQHFPVPADPHRLATSVRLAARIAGRRGRQGSSDATNTAARAPLVVVVEDDEALHALIAAMLGADVELVFESNGAAAFERIHAIGPDLVLMDIGLPGSDGVSITEQIKATPDLAAIPVIMLTGEARFETLVRSMEAGAADFLVKPFTRDALVAKLGKFLPAVA